MSLDNCDECNKDIDTDYEGISCWNCGGSLCEDCQMYETCPICGAIADETDVEE